MDFNKTFLIFEMSHKNKKTRKQAMGNVAQIISHLLKCKYSKEQSDIEHWMGELGSFRNFIINLQNKVKGSYNLEKDMDKNGMEDSYEDAKINYQAARRKNKFLPDIKELNLPTSCPWTFKEVIFDKIEKLISKLP